MSGDMDRMSLPSPRKWLDYEGGWRMLFDMCIRLFDVEQKNARSNFRVLLLFWDLNWIEEVKVLPVSPMLKEQKKIVVLDFGSQYNQLITRRIREIGVYSELHPHTVTAEEIKDMNATGIIFSGGPNSVYDKNAFSIDEAIFEMG